MTTRPFLIFVSFLATATSFAQSQTVKLKTVEGYINTKDSIRLFYNVTGEGKDTILIVPGGPYNFRYLSADLTPLAAHHTLIYYDLRASGFSSYVSDTTKLQVSNYVEDIETVRKFFKIKQLTFLGHSMGGLLCGYYAAKYPDKVKSIMLVNPAFLDTSWTAIDKSDSATNAVLKQNRIKYRNAPADYRKSCWDYYALVARQYFPTPAHARRMWGDVCYAIQENMMNPKRGYVQNTMSGTHIIAQLQKVKAPVLVLAGDDDFFPYASFEQWKNSFPNSAIIRFKGSGHFPHVDNPDLFFEAAEIFMQGRFADNTIYSSKGAGVMLPGDDKGSPYVQARAAVIRVENELVGLVNKGNFAGAAAVYSNDATIYAPGAPPIVGQQGIASFWHTASIRGMHSVELQLMDIEVSGLQLNARGKYVMRDKQGKYVDIGKFIALYRKDKGRWILYTDIFNSSLETRSPVEEPDYLILDKN